MARLTARGLPVIFAALLAACTAPAQPPATASVKAAPATPAKTEPVRAAPTRPAQLWPFTKFRGQDYVALRDIAKRYGLKAAWPKPGAVMTLRDAQDVRFTFERGPSSRR